jgi:hypothetical protein
VGYTRLAGGLKDEAAVAWIKRFPTHLVAEGIAYLCSSKNTTNGEMFSIGGGRVARNALYGGRGFHDPALTAEKLGAHFDVARDMSQPFLMTCTADENQRYDKAH